MPDTIRSLLGSTMTNTASKDKKKLKKVGDIYQDESGVMFKDEAGTIPSDQQGPSSLMGGMQGTDVDTTDPLDATLKPIINLMANDKYPDAYMMFKELDAKKYKGNKAYAEVQAALTAKLGL